MAEVDLKGFSAVPMQFIENQYLREKLEQRYAKERLNPDFCNGLIPVHNLLRRITKKLFGSRGHWTIMTPGGLTIRTVRHQLYTRLLVVAILLMLHPVAGGAVTAKDNFGGAVAAYRAGDHRVALESWRALANDGNPLAQYNVGLLHYQGHGTARSYAQALIWFHAAARQGLAASYLRLGAMFERGEGVPRDLEQAYLWYTLAISAFGPGTCRDIALDHRRTLAKGLTEAQVLKVLAESSEWAPGPLGVAGQPCFKSIAVRPTDGPVFSEFTAAQEPTASHAKKEAAAPAVVADPKLESRTQSSESVVEPMRQDPARKKPPAPQADTRAHVLMSQLPAKMAGGKEHSRVAGLVAPDAQQDTEAKEAEPLPTIDVAARKVHRAKAPDEGNIPMVGTRSRKTNSLHRPTVLSSVPAKQSAQEQPTSAASGPTASNMILRRSTLPPKAEDQGDASQTAGTSDMPQVARLAPATRRGTANPHAALPRRGVYVQLGALSTPHLAEQVWDRLQERNRDIFGKYEREIEKIRVKGGKFLYRLYAGPFDSGGRADAFCDSLKQRDEDCFVPSKFRKNR